jgi:hypothetical protein
MSRLLFAIPIVLLAFASSSAQKKDAPKKEAPPKIVVVPHLGVDPGRPTKLTVRGLGIDTVTEVQLQEPKASGRILGKGKKVGVPNNADPNRLGDSEIEIEVSLPSEVPGRTVPFSLVGPGGESLPHQLIVNDETPRMPEKEPNQGFRQAQTITIPSVIDGKVHEPQDVDVFRLDGKAGQTIRVEIQARRFGSPLEPMLYLYDSSNQLLTTAEAASAGSDPVLDYKFPRNGTYFLTLLDANDQGGSIFVYRLHLTGRDR